MPLDINKARKYLADFDFQSFFLDGLGWDALDGKLPIKLGDQTITLQSVAEKRGMIVYLCQSDTCVPPAQNQQRAVGVIFPSYPTRCRIESQLAKCVREHLIVYVDKEQGLQIWQWVKREPGKPLARREHAYNTRQSGDALIQKLEYLQVTLEEEEKTTLPDVTGRAKKAFDLEKITKRFYDHFKTEHAAFLKFIDGIPDEDLERWYASVMINRLMFIYFIQKKGFLNGDKDYLRNKLKVTKDFYRNLLCPLFFEGFAKKASERSATINKLLGKVPYLNGGIFQPHQIEQKHGKTIEISNKAFERLFAFFDDWQWHLDDRPLRNDKEINPDVLGYIFEKYINQKQMGAYYTKEDITEYIGKNTIIPRLFDMAKAKCKVAFEQSGTGVLPVWNLLKENPDRYIYDAVKLGAELPLPPEIEKGVDVTKPNLLERRKEWNKPAPSEYALPTEIWREVVARRQRYEEVKTRLQGRDGSPSRPSNGAFGKSALPVTDINDLITLNLNIRQFAQDVIENCEGPELLVAFWNAIERVTVLDPTCGSGAFLFAALNILEPLYEACLDRMQVFLDEWGEHGKKKHPNYHKLFTEILERVEQHPNRRYFIFKTIILNNLYGVDIMEEAVEICKLRLFLKLAAQVDPDTKKENYGIEPLPDIDFNIRAGNTLVGFATEKEVRRCMTEFGGGQQRLGIGDELKSYARFADKLQIADAAFRSFREQQTRHGGYVSKKDKDDLRKKLAVLDDELNRYLAEEYTMGFSGKPKDYAAWLKSHQPFHWFVEFYGIMHQGGFDVIIGNPPYVEYDSTLRRTYQVRGYTTLDCGNLHAFVVERCLGLTTARGSLGFIVPLPSISTTRMRLLQNIVKPQPGHVGRSLWISAFDERPSNLFTGVDQRLIIEVFGPRAYAPVLATTGINRWASRIRETLFPCLSFAVQENASARRTPTILKIKRSVLENRMIERFYLNQPIENVRRDHPTKQILAYRTAGGRYWKVVLDKPFDSHALSEKIAYLDGLTGTQAVAIVSSSTFWWYYSSHFDMYNLKDYMIFGFMFSNAGETTLDSLQRLGRSLVQSLEANAEFQNIESKTRGIVKQKLYITSKSKPIIDEIDRVLAKHYGFTDEELDFIINYDIKYRMGIADDVEDDE